MSKDLEQDKKDKKSDEECIKEFLCDISCLDELLKEYESFNVFDVLKISRTEIRHSNMLAWLLDPNGNHGLNDIILRELFKWVTQNYTTDASDYYSVILDCENFEVTREWHNIDILLVSNHDKFVISIENKVDSTEHDNQLERYKNVIDEYYSNYKKLFLYLTPDSAEASDNTWKEIGYRDFYNFIQYAIKHTAVSDDVKFLIENYLYVLKRDIMTNEELVEISQKIYNKHRQALEIIFKNRPNPANELLNRICDTLKEKDNIIFNRIKKTKFYAMHFNTEDLNKIIPPNNSNNSAWNTCDNYYYEFDSFEGDDEIQIELRLVLSRKDLSPEINVIQEKIINELSPKGKKGDKYKTVSSKQLKISKQALEFNDIINNNVDELLEWINDLEKKIKACISQ